MNSIKHHRTIQGIQQKDLAKMVGVDAAMMSRFESGACLPSVETANALASALSVPVRALFDRGDADFILHSKPLEETPAVDNIMCLVLNYISKDKTKPTSREKLSIATGISDRSIRNIIERLRIAGFMIVNSGAGYYITDDIDEIERQYKTDCKRARSIFYRLYPMRKILKEAGKSV